jgi:hypothetical protein
MNELIRSIAIKADPEFFNEEFDMRDLIYLEDFAHLIIRECRGVLEASAKKWDEKTFFTESTIKLVQGAIDKGSTDILKHFWD